MTIPRIAFPVLGLAALGIGLATTTGMSRSSKPEPGTKLKLDTRTEAALATLHEEIQRRFHDRNDIDFGFNRMVRPKARMHHRAPLMERWGGLGQTKTRTKIVKKDGVDVKLWEIDDPELGWTSPEKFHLRPVMVAENDRETQAIGTLRKSNVDVAVYTFGLIGQDSIPPRAKGPGYISRLGETAPPAAELVKFAQQAWRAKGKDVILEGPDGWYLMAHRVEADGKDCVSCHAHTRPETRSLARDPANIRPLYSVGDDIGLVVIAVRPRTRR